MVLFQICRRWTELSWNASSVLLHRLYKAKELVLFSSFFQFTSSAYEGNSVEFCSFPCHSVDAFGVHYVDVSRTLVCCDWLWAAVTWEPVTWQSVQLSSSSISCHRQTPHCDTRERPDTHTSQPAHCSTARMFLKLHPRSKKLFVKFLSIPLFNFDRFPQFHIGKLDRQFVTKMVLKFLSHLKGVATLSWEMVML